jgi:hypothetical protein
MSMSLLDYVQAILSSLESDEVNSITDTAEATTVARAVQTAYKEILARADLPEHYTLFQLTASGNNAKPTLMFRPDDVLSIEWIKYDIQTTADPVKNFQTLDFIALDQFLQTMYNLRSDDDNVEQFTHSVSGETITFQAYNDRAPTQYTTFDDDTVVFNAFDNTVDTTLQQSKTVCYGRKNQTWTMSDSYVPFLDPDFEIILLNEAKALAFAELKQIQHQKAEQSLKRLWSHAQKSKRGINNPRDELLRAPDYGRK